MNPVSTPVVASGPLAQLRLTAVQTWRELVRLLAVGGVVLLSGVPLALAALAGAPAWMLALTVAPVALAATGLAHVGASIADGGRIRLRSLAQVDGVLAFVILAAVAGSGLLIAQDGATRILGFALAGAALLVLPRALAYGAVRGRAGFAALRGGAILAAYRPGTTLVLLSLGVLGGFAVVASFGTLALVVPGFLSALAARMTADELAAIDTATGAVR